VPQSWLSSEPDRLSCNGSWTSLRLRRLGCSGSSGPATSAAASPGCGRPAAPTDLDHVRNFGPLPGDGKTVRANLGPLCRQHHNAKTHGQWTLVYDPVTGLKSWTSPLGRTYEKAATPIRT
jgi:hypothetical protein